MGFTVCKSGAYGLCNMDPFIEISLIIKQYPMHILGFAKHLKLFPLCVLFQQ